jgi:hypothetical protein
MRMILHAPTLIMSDAKLKDHGKRIQHVIRFMRAHIGALLGRSSAKPLSRVTLFVGDNR